VTDITDCSAKAAQHGMSVQEVATMFGPTMLVLCALGAFYVVLGVSLVRKARKPSCRTCVYWQDCLSTQLGTDTPPKHCL
jgi:hypothetical protein